MSIVIGGYTAPPPRGILNPGGTLLRLAGQIDISTFNLTRNYIMPNTLSIITTTTTKPISCNILLTLLYSYLTQIFSISHAHSIKYRYRASWDDTRVRCYHSCWFGGDSGNKPIATSNNTENPMKYNSYLNL